MTMGAKNDHLGGPERLAPHVDRAWVRSFVTGQNLRGVAPDRIGDHLATVESHVRESGEGAAEAFGDPVDYARALPAGAAGRMGTRTVLYLVLGLAGMLLVHRAAMAWLAEDTVTWVTVGDLVSLGLLGLGVVVLLVRPAAVLRVVVERPLVAWAGSVLILVALVVAQLALGAELAPLPVLPVAALGVVALATSSLLALRDEEPDEITGPGEAPRRSSVTRRVTVWLYPLLTVGLVLLAWVPTLFG